MAIQTSMTGQELDRLNKPLSDAISSSIGNSNVITTPNSSGMVMYISNGQLAFEDGEVIFNVTEIA